MSAFKFFVLVGLLALLVACAKPVPSDKANYVGQWKSRTTSLLITREGSVVYGRTKGGVTTSINAPLREFNGNNFDVGVVFKTTFVVSKPPYQVRGKWKMTVNGVILTRVEDE